MPSWRSCGSRAGCTTWPATRWLVSSREATCGAGGRACCWCGWRLFAAAGWADHLRKVQCVPAFTKRCRFCCCLAGLPAVQLGGWSGCVRQVSHRRRLVSRAQEAQAQHSRHSRHSGRIRLAARLCGCCTEAADLLRDVENALRRTCKPGACLPRRSLNAANWQWLSASAFFSQYFRVYSPIA